MKRNFIKIVFILVSACMITTCGKTYIEENQDKYKPTDVIPVVIKAEGPTLALQTKSYNYEVKYDRAGSLWTWSAVDATVVSVSSDTKKATVRFDIIPSNDTALIKVKETTSAGVISDEKVIKVRVNPFCPLQNGMSDLVGSWAGEDAYYYESIITTEVNDSTSIKVNGISVPFIEDWWGEEVVEGGTCILVVNDDGTITIQRQYIYTTVYEGEEYRYEIKGSGTWDNCGNSPSMKIKYDIYYEGETKGIAEKYASYLPNPYLFAEIALEETKSGDKIINLLNSSTIKRPKK